MGRIFLVVVALALLFASPAYADEPKPTPRTVDELLRAYDIENAPADFVVVVDTSSSMMEEPPLYPGVVDAFKTFVAAIGDMDHLSVITFDETPHLRFSGDVSTPEKRAEAENSLPATADGEGTDIGAALSAALERLERPGSNEVQTLIFLTDGQIYAPGSAYESLASPAWGALAGRANQVAVGHRLSTYGAGLGGKATDVAALKQVFPSTQIVSLPADQLSAFFNETVQRTRVERLYTPITNELQEGFIAVDVTPGELASTTKLSVRLRSQLPHLGAKVILKSVTVSNEDGQSAEARLIDGPRTIDLGPDGISDPITVEVDQSVVDGPWVGTETQSAQFTVLVDADVSAQPADVIGTELGITTPARVVQADKVTAQRTVGIPVWWYLVALAALVLAILIFLWIYRRYIRTPPLQGGVLVAQKDFKPFRGRVTLMPGPRDLDIHDTDGASVEFFTKRAKFRKGIPRVYVRRHEGFSAIEKIGVSRPLSAEGEQILQTDIVIVGRARLTYLRKEI